jgi:uncharacterized protein YktB (UPF0637 family)
MELFTLDDFKIFEIPGFSQRMSAILTRIRPKLTSMGVVLAPQLSPLVDVPLYVHVAKHARRTVNPPDDTWTALGANPRGYKKDVHFKIAISRNCVRFLFEAGPEYYAKEEWAKGWNREFRQVMSALRARRELAWFRNEHDEEPAALASDIDPANLKKLCDELTRRKDGQLVLGRRIDAAEFTGLKAKQVEKIVVDTFKPLAPLFHMVDARVLA